MFTRAQWHARKRDIADHHATPSDARGALQLLSVFAPIVGLWIAIAVSAPISWWLVAAETGGLSLFLLRGFVLMHDCGHNSLLRSRSLNGAAGFLLGVLSGMPQQVWAENHRYHHATNGNWQKYRGPLNVTGVAEYLAMSLGERRRYRYARDILLSPVAGGLYFLVNPRVTWLRSTYRLARRALARAAGRELRPDPRLPSPAHYRYMTWNNVVLLSAWALMAWTMGPALFCICYIVSGSLAGGYGIILFTVQHNFEHAYASADEGWDRDQAALDGTSYLILPRWLNWITADAAYHHVHHLCASVPNYRLAACHREHEAFFASVTRVGLYQIPAALKNILWDSSARRLDSVAAVMARA